MPETNQSIDINAPIYDVWAKLNNFHDFSWAPNVITSVDKVGDIDGGQVGAKRILNNAFHETLVEIDNNNYSLKYSIDDGPSPVSKNDVSNYFGSINLSTSGDNDQTHVSWTSSWESNSEDAVEFCHGIYVALLNELDASFS
ncbi:MAG: SRPBCC family protein [Gammaproteobacteria bacterium]|nr:MAG: SRPBCC family protein [Gammaproteobacteria bacterium]